MNHRAIPLRVVPLILLIGTLGVALRTLWLTADPPSHSTVGIVWHDEGAWVHNARNRALWGEWRTDEWNPMYLAPVFTGLEYVAFAVAGVGTWQARLVPVASGLAALFAVWWGLNALAGRRAALVGLALLSTNYFFVMWNRAALMESTLTAWIVIGWAAYAAAARRPAWALLAGPAAILAVLTKASAIFFVGALGLEAVCVLAIGWSAGARALTGAPPPTPVAMRAAGAALLGLTLGGLAALVAFVLPNWTEVQFYNWQMSVTRKPVYTLEALMTRATWLAVVHDVVSRMWVVIAMSGVMLVALATRWWRAPTSARLLAWWLLLGLAELVIHDSGNERRYVMLVPAFTALAACLAAQRAADVLGPDAGMKTTPWTRWAAAAVALVAAYLAWGGLVRLPDLERIYAHDLARTVRVAAGLALLTAAFAWWKAPALAARLASTPSTALVASVVSIIVLLDLAQFVDWARRRTSLNHQASIALAAALPAETLVHGKLANGLSLENRIRPVFVGREFGNYADRLSRPDIRYILTYLTPRVGYEGSVIEDVIRAYPGNQVVATFPVDETDEDDVAALILKIPSQAGLPGVKTVR